MNDLMPTVLVIAIMALVIYGVWRVISMPFRNRGSVSTNGSFVCPHCGTRGTPRMHTKGNLAFEIFLWLLLLLPGIIYSVWRLSTKQLVCPSCAQPGMLSVSTPKGKQLAAQFAAPQ